MGEGARARGPAQPRCLKHFLKAWQPPRCSWLHSPHPLGEAGRHGVPPGRLADIHTEEHVSSHPATTGSQGNARLWPSHLGDAMPEREEQHSRHCSTDVPQHTAGLMRGSLHMEGLQAGASEGRRDHSFAFSPPVTQHEQEHAGILNPEVPNGVATMSCASTKHGSARKMSSFTLVR